MGRKNTKNIKRDSSGSAAEAPWKIPFATKGSHDGRVLMRDKYDAMPENKSNSIHNEA